MADAGTIFIPQPSASTLRSGIHLYTHWDGYTWPETLRQALHFAKSRWHDTDYLNRIVIRQMFSKIHEQTTGGGIGFVAQHTFYPVIILDTAKLAVHFSKQDDYAFEALWYGEMSFAEFTAQPKAVYTYN